jgi:hypothetical protein
MNVRLCAICAKPKEKEVIVMLILNGGIVMLAALNLAVNAAVGLMILLRCPHVMWPITIRRPDRWYEESDRKSTEKGETSNEQSLG